MAIKITWYDHYPNGNKEYTTDLTQLNGGLNIRDLPQHLKATESPKLENMWWENGVLAARPGQEQVGTAVLGRRWLKYAWPKTERVAEQVRVVMGDNSRYVTVLTFRYYEVNPVTNPDAEVVTFTLTQRPELTDTEVAELVSTYMRGNYFQTAEGGPVYLVDSDTQVSYVGRGRTAGLYAVGAVLITDAPGTEMASVLDNDPNAYPTNGQQGGYWYIRQDDEEAYACSSEPFHGKVVAHVGAYMYWFDLGNPEVHQIAAGVPLNRGTFFRYQDYLFYKNRGGFYRIRYSSGALTAEAVTGFAYVPTTFLNADPDTGAGDSYQAANLLTQRRKVEYSPRTATQVKTFTGNGTQVAFAVNPYRGDQLQGDDPFDLGIDRYESVSVSVNGTTPDPADYDIYTFYTGLWYGQEIALVFHTAPADGATIEWTLRSVSGRYVLPGGNRELGNNNATVQSVKSNGWSYDPIGNPQTFTGDGSTATFRLQPTLANPGQYPAELLGVMLGDGSSVNTDNYSYDNTTGYVTLSSAPASGVRVFVYPCGYYAPFTISNQYGATVGPYDLWLLPAPWPAGTGVNQVEVTYTLTDANATGFASLMSCPYAITGGGQDSLSILLGGSTTQPSAVYWNSNDSISMNPGYFPDNYYQLVGDSDEFVTGFGRQYSDVIALKEHSLYKMQYEVLSVDDRDTLSFTFPSINGKIGCDLPWSIQLIENNLVFCNTYTGVHILLSSSAAYENNVECISRKVNGNPAAGATWGLLYDVRNSALPVVGYDDDRRYWLCANGHVYLWDYDVSGYKDPSWFYFTNVKGTAYFRDDEHRTHHFSAGGRITVFNFQVHSDYGEAFRKVYQTPVLYFGQYNYLKDVRSLLLAVQSATGGEVQVTYDTDYVTRADLTPLPLRSPSPGYAQRRVEVTIPRGRMRGDANGDGYINDWDLSVIYDYLFYGNEPEPGTEDYEAGVNVFGDGTPLNILTYQAVYEVIRAGRFGAWPEVTGNWVNTHLPGGEPQFYTDITIPTDEVLQWGGAQVLTDAEWYHSCAIVDGKLRVYANTCPIEAVNLEALLTPALPANYLPTDGWRFAEVFRRKPVCRHIRHFQMTLSNEEADQDMAIDAIQVFHTIQDKQR